MKCPDKIFSVLMISIVFFSCSDQEPIRTGLEGKPLPNFSILLQDSNSVIKTGDINNKSPIVLLYFSPYCPYCKSQIENIVKNINSLVGIQFLFVSSYSISEIRVIYDKYNLSKYNNVALGQDTDFKIAKYFGSYNVPYLAIYNRNKKLKHAFLGKLDISQLKDVAESEK